MKCIAIPTSLCADMVIEESVKGLLVTLLAHGVSSVNDMDEPQVFKALMPLVERFHLHCTEDMGVRVVSLMSMYKSDNAPGKALEIWSCHNESPAPSPSPLGPPSLPPAPLSLPPIIPPPVSPPPVSSVTASGQSNQSDRKRGPRMATPPPVIAENLVLSPPPPNPPPKKKPAQRMYGVEHFDPSDEDIEWARESCLYITDSGINAETDKFKRYYTSVGRRFASWGGVWRNWIQSADTKAGELLARKNASRSQYAASQASKKAMARDAGLEKIRGIFDDRE